MEGLGFKRTDTKIVSFYSYKGGVGRTQLAANLAAYLCYHRGRKVLLLEWDLEAPGLHYYFGKESEDLQGEGLMELLENYVQMMRNNQTNIDLLPKIDKKNIISLKNDAREYAGRKGKIDLFPAGNYNNNFSKRVNEFNWEEFKTLLDGNMYMDMFREQLKNLDYDYVFIDSRTGVSDYSGYCTILLPDMNVFVVAPNSQNYWGTEGIVKNIVQHPFVESGYRKLYLLPILSRLDKDANDFDLRLESFSHKFAYLLNSWGKEIDPDILPFLFDEYFLKNTFLEYTKRLATGENLLFDYHARKTSALAVQGNFEYIAEKFLEKMYENKNIDFEESVTADDWFDWATKLYDKKKYTSAKYCLEKVIELRPDFHETWNSLGVVFLRLNQQENAKESFEKALEIKPDYDKSNYNLACWYSLKEDKEKAFEYLQKAILLNPKCKQAAAQEPDFQWLAEDSMFRELLK